MRHAPAQVWGRYVTAAREAALISKAELARRVGVTRETVSRWETTGQRPDSAELIYRVAKALDLDLQETLAAAGMVPGAEAPTEPTRPADPELDLIRQHPRLSVERKKQLIQWVLMRRAREEQARMEDLQQMVGDA